jgi:Integrase core domain
VGAILGGGVATKRVRGVATERRDRGQAETDEASLESPQEVRVARGGCDGRCPPEVDGHRPHRADGTRRRASTEFTSRAFDHWAYTNGVQLDFSRPGKPTDNATIESFNASVRRECLSQHYFSTLAEARVVLAAYRDDFNNQRPHSSLG